MKRKRKFIKLAALFLVAMVLTSGMSAVTVSAETPYRTFTVNGYGGMEETQTAYLAHETIIKFGEEFMSAPKDICVTDDGKIYVADTGNSRILVGTTEGELEQIIGEGTLKSPQGVFVTEDKHVYVADSDAEAVFEFDPEGNVLNRYTKPDNPLYGGAKVVFKPIKVVVNESGIMFVICESNTNGIVEISPQEGGSFLGYFGTNLTSVDLVTMIFRAVASDAQRAKMISNIPSTPDNLAIDEKGLIYTVTRGDNDGTLKRLNIAGANLINGANLQGYYDDSPAAVAIGNHDNIYVASSQGYIYEYNNQGEPIYLFGGRDDGTQRVGLSTQVESIQVGKNDEIYVLDSDRRQIQVYKPSEFTQKLHNALYLYSKGRYTESREPLSDVLKMNSMFDYANRAMGRAYFQEENYDEALRYARLSKDHSGYSDAFWEIRNDWLKKNIVAAMVTIVLIIVLYKLLKFWDKKKGVLSGLKSGWAKFKEKKLVSNLFYSGYYMKHPFDASYGIAREGRASWSAPSILLVIFMVEYVINKYLCGFLQKNVREGRYDIFSDIGTILVVIVALTACNYLVCTINDGEGTIKKIYTYFCYSLLPYILLTPISFALSHVLTWNEQFIITLIQVVMFAWILIIGILGIKEVNNYTGKETAKIIALTLFTILIVSLLIFIIYVLWAQVFEFISAIYGEVVYRLEK
ncbi:hypothetical protein D7V82_07800 [bacterium 1xD8-6]|nr:hypothetical protein D7V72_08895 [bacterium D16-36]RKI70384.1 hypothetical protein D7V82_07800 [bacterium 1xD8-6]